MGKNFAGQDLQGQSFAGQNLVGADFRGANVSGCDFSEANLRGARFDSPKRSFTNASEAKFSKADIRGANFARALLQGSDFAAAKAGTRRRTAVLKFLLVLALSLLANFLSSFLNGALLGSFLTPRNIEQYSLLPAILIIVFNLGFIALILRYGLTLQVFTTLIMVVIFGFVFIIIAVAVAVAVAVAGAFAGAVAVAVAVAFTGAGAVAVAVAGAGAGAVVVAVAVVRLTERGRGTLAYALLTTVLALALIGALTLLPWAKVNDAGRSIFLFLGLLPLVNAITDYASYAVTIWLVGLGLKTPGWAFVMGLVDVAVALLIFALLGVLLVLVVAGANALASEPLFPLAPLFAGLRQDPWAYIWVYAMLFSTLLPTLAHLVLAVFSMIALPFFVMVKMPLSGWIKVPDHTTALAGPLILGFAVTVSVLLPCLVAWGLYALAAHFWLDLATVYLDQLEALARWLGEV